MFKKNLSLLLAGILTISCLTAGCGNNSGNGGESAAAGNGDSQAAATETGKANKAASGEVITLTFFDKNTGDAFDNPVAQAITEKTGIKIEVQQPTGNPEEKLNLMLASGDLPDIVLMDRRSDIVNKYIAAGALVPLNDLIDQYGADIQEMYGDILNKSRYEDGKNYYLNNWYGLDPDPDRAFCIRMDVLKELGYGEKAEKGEAFTQDEFRDILSRFKETYKDADGQPAIPLTSNADYMPSVLSTFKAMYGMKNYYEKDGKLFFDVRDPDYLEMVKYMNGLYRDGLLDKEWAVNKEQIFTQKAGSGRVAATVGLSSDGNRLLKEDNGEDTDKQFYMFKVVADGVDPDKTTFSPRSSLGWDAIGITVKNEHPVETIKFMNFLASEEGQYLLMWGIEGKDWDMEDGKHVPRPETLQGFKDDWNTFAKETGIRKWTWFIKNGYGSDGTPYDLATKYERDAVSTHALTSMANSTWDTAPYDYIGPAAGTPEALSKQKIKDIIDTAFTNMVYADSEEQVVSLYDAMISEIDANQASAIEAVYTEKYNEQLALWK